MRNKPNRWEAPWTAPFRFLDLPRELRDKIYKLLLCDFEEAGFKLINDFLHNRPSTYYVRTVHPAILRANKQVHCEAYTTMVKTNRFVLVKFYGGLPFDHMLETFTRRIISQRFVVEAFKGHVMTVSVVPEGRAWFESQPHLLVEQAKRSAVHCMILGEDCSGLIKMLADVHMPNLSKALDITIAVAPYLEDHVPAVKSSLEPFFSEEGTQENLLLPFRKRLRGVQNVKVTGVAPILATAATEDMAKDEWTDPHAVLADLQASKQRGNDAFKAKELRAASHTWEDAVDEIERIHQSSSWRNISSKGGTAFIDAVVELYFLMCLNITHVQLTGIDHPIRGYPPSHLGDIDYLSLAQQQIDRIMNARTPDWWAPNYKWEPSGAQYAKLLFRHAKCLKADARVNNVPEMMLEALRQLEKAHQVMPDDPAIAKERDAVEREWTRMMMELEAEEGHLWEEDVNFVDEDELHGYGLEGHIYAEDEFEDDESEDDESEDDESEDDEYEDESDLEEEDADDYSDLPDLV